MFCVPSLLVTFQLTCVLLGICFGDAMKAAFRVALKCVEKLVSSNDPLPRQLAISNSPLSR